MVAFACYDLSLSGQLLARCVPARLFAGETFACKDVSLNNGYTSWQKFMYRITMYGLHVWLIRNDFYVNE